MPDPARVLRPHDHREEVEGDGLLGGADVHEGAVGLQQREVGVELQRGRDRRHDEVEGARELLEGRLVAGRVVVVGAQLEAVLLLAEGLRQDGHLGTQRVRDLDAHVAEAAETDDGDLLAGACCSSA